MPTCKIPPSGFQSSEKKIETGRHFNKNYYFSGKHPVLGGSYKNYDDYEHKHPYEWAKRYFKHARGHRILDIGGATGAFLSHLPKSYERVCVDISTYAIKKGRGLHKDIKFYNCDVVDFSCRKKFSIITAFDCLEHVKNVQGALDKIYSLLDDGGIFIFTVPIASKFHHLLASFGFSLLTCDISHVTLTTEKSWKNYILDKKWEILEDRKLTVFDRYIPPLHIYHIFVLKKRKEGGGYADL